jgi:hypothetical protein
MPDHDQLNLMCAATLHLLLLPLVLCGWVRGQLGYSEGVNICTCTAAAAHSDSCTLLVL